MNDQLEAIIMCLRKKQALNFFCWPPNICSVTCSFSINSGSVQEDISWYIQIYPVCNSPQTCNDDHKQGRRWAVCVCIVLDLIRRYLHRFFGGFHQRKLNFHVVGSLRFVLLIKDLLDLLTGITCDIHTESYQSDPFDLFEHVILVLFGYIFMRYPLRF